MHGGHGQAGVSALNLNWHLQADEVAWILDDSGAGALVTHVDLRDQVERGGAPTASLPVLLGGRRLRRRRWPRASGEPLPVPLAHVLAGHLHVGHLGPAQGRGPRRGRRPGRDGDDPRRPGRHVGLHGRRRPPGRRARSTTPDPAATPTSRLYAGGHRGADGRLGCPRRSWPASSATASPPPSSPRPTSSACSRCPTAERAALRPDQPAPRHPRRRALPADRSRSGSSTALPRRPRSGSCTASARAGRRACRRPTGGPSGHGRPALAGRRDPHRRPRHRRAAGRPATTASSTCKPAQGRFEYHNDPAKTADTWRDDAFSVGDIGHLDADGWLYLTDRAQRPDHPGRRQRLPAGGRGRCCTGIRRWSTAPSSAYPTTATASTRWRWSRSGAAPTSRRRRARPRGAATTSIPTSARPASTWSTPCPATRTARCSSACCATQAWAGTGRRI